MSKLPPKVEVDLQQEVVLPLTVETRLDQMSHSGYWQIEIDEKDRHETAFITKHHLFEHKQLAFGLCNAPATFQYNTICVTWVNLG